MDENARESLRAALAAAIGGEQAAVLMERIPPVTWDELARQEDMLALRSDVEIVKADVRTLKADVGTLKTDVGTLKTDVVGLKVDVARLGPELTAEFRRQIIEQNRLLFFGTMGAVFTSASLAFAAVRF